jgi:hypothetical protein
MRDNPNTRGLYLRLLKSANPGISVPELDVEVRTANALKTRDAEIAALREKDAQRERRDHALALYEGLKDDSLVQNKADFADLVKYASENGFVTTEQGLRKARAFQQQERAAAVPTPQGFRTLLPKDNKDLMKNPKEWSRKEAFAAVNDIIKARSA